MSHRRRWTTAAFAVALGLALALASGAVARRPKPDPCPDGRFVLPAAGAPLVGTADAIVLAGGTVALSRATLGGGADGCDAVPATIRARRKGTKVRARWTSCGAVERVRLSGTIAAPACDGMAGRLKTKGAKAIRFTATRDAAVTTTTTTTTLPPGPARTGLDALYALRDEVLAPTVRGQHYVDLFDAHNTEILAWLMHGEGLYEFGAPAFLAWMPAFEALVNGQGDAVVITSAQIAALEEFFARLSTFASPTLAQVIADELAAVPLDTLAGKTMSEARALVLDDASGTTMRAAARVPSPRAVPGCTATCLLVGECNYAATPALTACRRRPPASACASRGSAASSSRTTVGGTARGMGWPSSIRAYGAPPGAVER